MMIHPHANRISNKRFSSRTVDWVWHAAVSCTKMYEGANGMYDNAVQGSNPHATRHGSAWLKISVLAYATCK